MASGDSNVVRIVNLDDTFTEEILKNCILINCRPEGDVKKIYLKRDDKTKTSYGYVVFENSYDALKMTQTLNGHIYISNKLEIELIGPNLKYRIYGKDNKVLRLLGTTGTVLKTHTRQNLDGLLARRQSALNRKHFVGPSSASNIERARNKRALGDKNVVKCRSCNGDHWTSMCPWKDTLLAGGKVPDDKKAPAPSGATSSGDSGKAGGSKYIPPSMRDGATKRTDGPSMARRDDSYSAIRIANLSDSTTETDLEDLVKPFGPIQKLYLAKDKQTGLCKGFAYIHFKFRNDAAKAISMLNGYGYDHLILNVDWSKPLSSSNQ